MGQIRIGHVFGPVPSRRLGRSLGLDLVPLKACSYDCIYCQLGRTTNRTVERREYVPMTDVLIEVEERLATGVAVDHVTLSGSGEPTLHAHCGDIIRTVKTLTKAPVAVLTNGSLLWDPAVREELGAADIVIPSLDAGDANSFKRVNRPHPSLTFERVVEGLRRFGEEYHGQIWIEILLVEGVTADREEASKIADQLGGIRADRIQLGTVARPPAEYGARAAPLSRLQELAELFGDIAEVVHGFGGTLHEHEYMGKRERVVALLQRQPCTLEDVSAAFEMNVNEAAKLLDGLVADGLVHTQWREKHRFFVSPGL